MDDVFRTRWPRSAPWEEVWFLQLRPVEPCGVDGLWVRYTLQHGQDATAGVWAMVGRDGAVRGAVDTVSLAHARVGDGVLVATPAGALHPHRAVGAVRGATWDLELISQAGHHRHVPALIGRFGRTYESAAFDLLALGSLDVGDGPRQVSFRGVLGHIFGKRNRVQHWAWCHQAGFPGHPEARFEGVSAQIGRLPALTSLRVDVGERSLAFSDTVAVWRATSDLGADTWRFAAANAHGRVEGKVTLGAVALVQYHDEEGRPIWCRNSRGSRLEVHATWAGEAPVTLTCEDAAFELGGRQRPEGVVVASG